MQEDCIICADYVDDDYLCESCANELLEIKATREDALEGHD